MFGWTPWLPEGIQRSFPFGLVQGQDDGFNKLLKLSAVCLVKDRLFERRREIQLLNPL